MKKIFTLYSIVLLSFFSTSSSAQFSENFDSGLPAMTSNCWQFSDMMYATSPSAYIINGNGSLYSEPPVSSDSVRIMLTPFLAVGSSLNVVFNYRLSNNLNGQATRFIKIDLINSNNEVAQTLDSFQVTNTAITTVNYNQTFAVNVPADYKISITLGGKTGGGNVRVSLDDLYANADLVGCFARPIVLPVHLISFQGNMNKNNKVTLNWTVADNETVSNFEVERSINGRDFTTVGVVIASEKISTENYTFYETVTSNDKVMYRLKMIDKGHDIDYSRILVFNTKAIVNNNIKIIGNPVNDKLTFNFFSNASQQVSVKVYDIAGKTLLSQKVKSAEGNNTLSLSLASTLKPGMYVIEVNDGADRMTTKFVKQ